MSTLRTTGVSLVGSGVDVNKVEVGLKSNYGSDSRSWLIVSRSFQAAFPFRPTSSSRPHLLRNAANPQRPLAPSVDRALGIPGRRTAILGPSFALRLVFWKRATHAARQRLKIPGLLYITTAGRHHSTFTRRLKQSALPIESARLAACVWTPEHAL